MLRNFKIKLNFCLLNMIKIIYNSQLILSVMDLRLIKFKIREVALLKMFHSIY